MTQDLFQINFKHPIKEIMNHWFSLPLYLLPESLKASYKAEILSLVTSLFSEVRLKDSLTLKNLRTSLLNFRKQHSLDHNLNRFLLELEQFTQQCRRFVVSNEKITDTTILQELLEYIKNTKQKIKKEVLLVEKPKIFNLVYKKNNTAKRRKNEKKKNRT